MSDRRPRKLRSARKVAAIERCGEQPTHGRVLSAVVVRVGCYDYDLLLVEGPLVWRGGPCDGFYNGDSLRILVSTHCAPVQRVPVAMHELAHAFIYHHERNVTGTEGVPLVVESMFGWLTSERLRAIEVALKVETCVGGTPAYGP